MTAPGDSTVGPPLGEPIQVTPDQRAWARVRADLADHGTALCYARLGDLRPRIPEERGALRNLLGQDWSRFLDLGHRDARERHAVSRILLRQAADGMLGAGSADLELAYGPTGRPYLRGFDRLDISVSQSGDLLLFGLTSRGLVGVDAERTDRPMYGGGLGRRACTPYELVMLRSLPEKERNPSLVRLWTLKNAYSKATGQAAHFPFSEFGFGPDGKPVRVQNPDGSAGTGREWAFRTFVLDNGYSVSIAVYDAGLGEPSGPCPGPALDRARLPVTAGSRGNGDG